MRQKKYLLVLSLLLVTSSTGYLCGREQGRWTMEFRIAAHPTEDALIVELSKSSGQLRIYRNRVLVGKWVEVLESVEKHLEKAPNLVTRRNEEGRLELLVLITADDVNESDVRRISPSRDDYGRLALQLEFNDEGSSKAFNLTRKYAHRKPERYVAEIMDGKVHVALEIVAPVSGHALIIGDFDEALIEDIRQRSKKGLVVGDIYYLEPPPYCITITPLRLTVFFAIAFFVIVGSLPAKGLEKSRHPKVWTVVGIIAGLLVGAYKLGVTERIGAEATTVGVWDVDVVHIVTRIELLWVLVGGTVGAGVGYLIGRLCRFFVRRAIHNVVGLIFKVGGRVQEAGTRSEQLNE